MEKNIKAGFRGTGILFWDLDFIVSKLDVHLCMPIFPSSCSSFGRYWESQTPKTEKQACLQSHLIKNCIFTHQGSFFTLILEVVDWLAKGAQLMALEFIIICNEVCIFQNVNMAFAKCWKAKRTCLQKGGALS